MLIIVGFIDMILYIHKFKRKILHKMKNSKGVWFHLAGIICLIWFLFRVLPKPDRIRYPCQQMALGVAFGYITFWGILWSSFFFGLRLWIKHMKYKTAPYVPVLLVASILIFSVTSNVYADIFIKEKEKTEFWTPNIKNPIGVPTGANPGRVVWVWDADATEEELIDYWWNAENNNQYILDNMVSHGIQNLAGTNDDSESWDILFKYFNK